MTVYLASKSIKSASSKKETISKYSASLVRMRIINHVTTFWRPLNIFARNKFNIQGSDTEKKAINDIVIHTYVSKCHNDHIASI